MNKRDELRKIRADALCKVVNILEINDDWKRVMSIIPKNLLDENSGQKYNNEHIRLIEEHAKANNQKCAEILIDEWGTSGRVRPNLHHLKNILIKAQIFRAADEIANMLQEPLPERPSYGPAAFVTTDLTKMLNEEISLQQLNEIPTHKMTSSNKLYNGTTRQMESVSDMIEFSKTSANEYKDSKKSESNLMIFSKDTDTEKSMNLPALSVLMASKNISQKSTTPLTNNTDGSESSYQSYPENVSQEYSKYDMNNYQQSFPDIPITSTGIDSDILQDEKLFDFDYHELETITGNFSNVLEKGPKGLIGKIGSGGFGDVFVGKHHIHGMVAVKKAHSYLKIERKPDIAMKIFNAEVKYLSLYRHRNIVSIIGFSKNGPTPCIVSEYIDGGCLQDKIESKELKDESTRIFIMTEIAEGLKYLHTSKHTLKSSGDIESVNDPELPKLYKKFVHGDIKTANILLTKDCIPKLCDFGVAKQYDSTFMTTCFMGTSAYMAPEALQGTVTQKTDIFSYGIVLLELLTGLKPIIKHNGYNFNIKHYVEENCTDNDISQLLDATVESWTRANKIFNLASSCFNNSWKHRPNITQVCEALNNINNDTNYNYQ